MKHFIFLLTFGLILLGSIPPAVQADDMSTWQHLLNQASHVEAEGQYPEAEGLYKQALQHVNPENPSTTPLTQLAQFYVRRHKLAQALKTYETLIQQQTAQASPQLSDSLIAVANIRCTQKQLKKSKALFQKVLTLHQDAPEQQILTYQHQARCYQQHRLLTEALNQYQQILTSQRTLFGTQDPRTVDTLMALAAIYIERTEWDPAEQLYLQAIDISAQYQHTHHDVMAQTLHMYDRNLYQGLARLYKQTNQQDKAYQLEQKAMQATSPTTMPLILAPEPLRPPLPQSL